MEEKKEANEKEKKYNLGKSQILCYSSLYPNLEDDRLKWKIWQMEKTYKPFKNYLNLAKKAAEKKQLNGAYFNVVDRNIDYKLSCWLRIEVVSKIINGQLVSDLDLIEKIKGLNMPVDDIIVEKIAVDGKEVTFYNLDDSILFEANKNSKIIINDNPEIFIDKSEYKSNTVDYYGKTIECRKQKIAIEEYIGDECCDSSFKFIKYKINKDTDDQSADEFTIELIDDPSSDISVYETFFNDDQCDVFFDAKTRKRYKVPYKNKESGRLVIKSENGLDEIDLSGKVYLNTNTTQLSRQMNAIESITKRPSKYQKVLLSMCETRQNFGLENFRFIDKELDYKVLTDLSKEGTLKQREFVKRAIQTPDFMILQGPPGSGKTTAIVELIYQLIKEGKKVLLCASTHVAIDNVLEKIITHKESNELLSLINPVRVGDESNVYSDCVKDYIYSNIHKQINNEKYDDLVDESFNLVCGTVIGVLSFPLIDRKINDVNDGKKTPYIQTSIEPIFDYLILDEASKTTFSEFLVPATLCKRWIIVGDVKQLAPYVEKNDLIPSLLQCNPLASKDDRLAISFIKIFKNKKSNERFSNHAFVLNKSAIEYIDNKIQENSNIIAVSSSKNLKNVFSICADDIDDMNYKVAALISTNHFFLIEEGLIDKVLPLINPCIRFIHSEKDLRSSNYYNEYAIVHARKRFDSIYKDNYKDYSRKIEDEILWRLIRLYELDKDQSKAKGYQEYIDEIREILDESGQNDFDNTIDSLRNIAIPSIIMMLQEGINKNSKYKSMITSGLAPKDKAERFIMLDYQFRMHKDISKIPRENVYNNEALKDSKSWLSKMNYFNNKPRFEVDMLRGLL